MPKKAFVVGWPISHSLSPLMHGHWLKTHHIDGSYEAAAVKPEDLAAFLKSVAPGDWLGGNVTIPHKEAALACADRADGEAQAIGASNTIWTEGGRLCAGNTDAHGFAANLDDRMPGWAETGVAVVLGAGGGARAVVHALCRRRIGRIYIVNRTRERADDLCARFGRSVIAATWDDLPRALAGAGLLVNTTSLGMEGQPPLEIDLSRASPGLVVTDIVYAPLETPLLRHAAMAGLRTVDGLGMLLHQGVPGFERWFGVRPQVTAELRALLVAELERRRRLERTSA